MRQYCLWSSEGTPFSSSSTLHFYHNSEFRQSAPKRNRGCNGDLRCFEAPHLLLTGPKWITTETLGSLGGVSGETLRAARPLHSFLFRSRLEGPDMQRGQPGGKSMLFACETWMGESSHAALGQGTWVR